MKDFFRSFIDLLFPRICVTCSVFLSQTEEFLCEQCFISLPFSILSEYNSLDLKLFGKCNYTWALSLLEFRKKNKTKKIIHSVKYENLPKLGFKLGFLLGSKIFQKKLHNSIEAIIPVPMYKPKELQRGYNQSEVIAQGICKATYIKVDTDFLYKIHSTKSQTNKSKVNRETNLLNSFSISSSFSKRYSSILLVDDVVTTGSTVIECIKCFNNVGISEVAIASLACAN